MRRTRESTLRVRPESRMRLVCVRTGLVSCSRTTLASSRPTPSLAPAPAPGPGFPAPEQESRRAGSSASWTTRSSAGGPLRPPLVRRLSAVPDRQGFQSPTSGPGTRILIADEARRGRARPVQCRAGRARAGRPGRMRPQPAAMLPAIAVRGRRCGCIRLLDARPRPDGAPSVRP